MSVETAIVTIQTVALVCTCLGLAYPVVRYSQNVAHTEAVIALTVAFVLLTVGYVVDVLYGDPLVYRLITFPAAVVAFLSVWYFARPFVRLDEEVDLSAGTGTDDADGGFGDAVRE